MAMSADRTPSLRISASVDNEHLSDEQTNHSCFRPAKKKLAPLAHSVHTGSAPGRCGVHTMHSGHDGLAPGSVSRLSCGRTPRSRNIAMPLKTICLSHSPFIG